MGLVANGEIKAPVVMGAPKSSGLRVGGFAVSRDGIGDAGAGQKKKGSANFADWPLALNALINTGRGRGFGGFRSQTAGGSGESSYSQTFRQVTVAERDKRKWRSGIESAC